MKQDKDKDQKKTDGGPDAKELQSRDLPRGQFPGRGGQPFRIFLSPEVHEQILKHGRENLGVEVCGVLVGLWQQDGDGPFVAVTAAIAGEAAANKLAEVTFTHDTWSKINSRMDAEFGDKRIVGWYHTHPDFGIFLSDRDRFIHDHFFSDPGQIAYVVDPVRKEEGVFTWKEGKPDPSPCYWIGGHLQFGTGDAKRTAKETGQSANSNQSSAVRHAETNTREEPREYEGSLLTKAIWSVCVFLLGYLVASQVAAWQREQFVESTLVRFDLMKNMKPGLGTALSRLDQKLSVIGYQVENLYPQGRPTTQPMMGMATPAELASQLAVCRQYIGQLNAVYALTPEDEQMIQQLHLGGLASLIPKEIPTTQPAGDGSLRNVAGPSSNPTSSTSIMTSPKKQEKQ